MVLALEFDYYKPRRMKDAVALKARYGAAARFLAGGTDLINGLSDEVFSPEAVIDLKGIKELTRLEFRDGKLRLGGLVTFTDLLDSGIVRRKFPLLWEAASEVASVAVRNRATAVGNLCSAVPSMDIGPALLVYEATALIRGVGGSREIPVTGVLAGPKKNSLAPDEVLEELSIPLPAGKHGSSYVKQMRYRGEDLAQAGVAVLALPRDRYRVAFGAVGPVPARAEKIEQYLRGKKITDQVIAGARGLVSREVAPISDIRSSKEYRLHMCRVMLGRALRAAADRRSGKSPRLGEKLI